MKDHQQIISELTEDRQVKIKDRAKVIELGIRLLRSEGWSWMPGMAYYPGEPYDHETVWRISFENDLAHMAHDDIPIIDDPATKGCLFYLVRKYHDLPHAWTVYKEDEAKWAVCWSGATHGGELGQGDTEEEALVDALTWSSHD